MPARFLNTHIQSRFADEQRAAIVAGHASLMVHDELLIEDSRREARAIINSCMTSCDEKDVTYLARGIRARWRREGRYGS